MKSLYEIECLKDIKPSEVRPYMVSYRVNFLNEEFKDRIKNVIIEYPSYLVVERSLLYQIFKKKGLYVNIRNLVSADTAKSIEQLRKDLKENLNAGNFEGTIVQGHKYFRSQKAAIDFCQEYKEVIKRFLDREEQEYLRLKELKTTLKIGNSKKLICKSCGNSKDFIVKAALFADYLFEVDEDGYFGWVYGKDDTSSFLRYNSGNGSSVGIAYQDQIKCKCCGEIID